jgi:hypothetical protein
MISVWDRGSSVGIATSVRSGRAMMRGCPQQEEESALLFKASIPAQGLAQSSFLWMLRVKWTGRGAELPVLLKTTVIMPRGILPTPSPSKCLVLVCRFFKQRDNFTFAVLTWLRTLSTCEAMSHISQSDISFTLTSVGTRPHRTAQYIFRQFHCKFADSKGRFFFI